MDEQGQPLSSNDDCPCCIAALRPAPTGSSSRSFSRVNAQSNRDVEAGFGFRLRPFGFTGSSVMNSAQENSDCCGFGASVSITD